MEGGHSLIRRTDRQMFQLRPTFEQARFPRYFWYLVALMNEQYVGERAISKIFGSGGSFRNLALEWRPVEKIRGKVGFTKLW